jgi:hypothetical protein
MRNGRGANWLHDELVTGRKHYETTSKRPPPRAFFPPADGIAVTYHTQVR